MKIIDKDAHLILSKALNNIVFDGWNDSMLKSSASAAGYKENQLYIYFPKGVFNLVDFFNEQNILQLEERAAGMDKSFRLHEKISWLVIEYFKILNQYKPQATKLAGYYALPGNQAQALKNLYILVDNIWRLAGDRSTDFSYYTKRLTLASIISQTYLFWMSDYSEDFAETRNFLSRRMKEVALIGKMKSKMKETVKFFDLRPVIRQFKS